MTKQVTGSQCGYLNVDAVSDDLGYLRHPQRVTDTTALCFTAHSPLQLGYILLELNVEA